MTSVTSRDGESEGSEGTYMRVLKLYALPGNLHISAVYMSRLGAFVPLYSARCCGSRIGPLRGHPLT